MKLWQFGTIAMLMVGLISAVLYLALKPEGGGGGKDVIGGLCPIHSVPLGPNHWGPCPYQHGEVVFVNDLHEGDITVTIDTGHDKGKFCDHTEHELVKVLHHAEIVVLEGMANGPHEFSLLTFDGETFKGHVKVEPKKQIRCGVTRGPNGLTCDIFLEDHEEEEEH